MTATAENIVKRGDCYSYSALKINGSDLARIGFRGEEIGVIMKRLLFDVIDGKLTNDGASLKAAAVKAYERQTRA